MARSWVCPHEARDVVEFEALDTDDPAAAGATATRGLLHRAGEGAPEAHVVPFIYQRENPDKPARKQDIGYLEGRFDKMVEDYPEPGGQ